LGEGDKKPLPKQTNNLGEKKKFSSKEVRSDPGWQTHQTGNREDWGEEGGSKKLNLGVQIEAGKEKGRKKSIRKQQLGGKRKTLLKTDPLRGRRGCKKTMMASREPYPKKRHR